MVPTFVLGALGIKRVALASFPRSGNTWLRFMIEQATRRKSGSVHDDRIMPRTRRGVVIKTHLLDSDRYTHAIHIIRNPFDAIESYFQWKRQVAGLDDITWQEHVERSTLEWRDHTQHWLQAKCVVYRIRYEDVHRDPVNQMRWLLSWLGYELSSERLAAVVEAASLNRMREGNPELGTRFFRRGQVGEGVMQFTDEQRQYMKDRLRESLHLCAYEEELSLR